MSMCSRCMTRHNCTLMYTTVHIYKCTLLSPRVDWWRNGTHTNMYIEIRVLQKVSEITTKTVRMQTHTVDNSSRHTHTGREKRQKRIGIQIGIILTYCRFLPPPPPSSFVTKNHRLQIWMAQIAYFVWCGVCVCVDKILPSSYIFSRFARQWSSLWFLNFQQNHTVFELRKSPRFIRFLSLSFPQNSTFVTLELFLEFLLRLQQHLQIHMRVLF